MEYNMDKSTEFYIEQISISSKKLGEWVGIGLAIDLILERASKCFLLEQDKEAQELREIARQLKSLGSQVRMAYDNEYKKKQSDAWSILDNCIRKTDYPDVHEIK